MKHIEVVCAIIREGATILATQRGYGEFKGKWEFPGGKIEVGEAPETALVREINEELAVTIAVESRLCTVNYAYPTFHLTLHCYWCHITEGTPKLLEHQSARWLTPNALHDVDWLPADVEVVEQIKKHLN